MSHLDRVVSARDSVKAISRTSIRLYRRDFERLYSVVRFLEEKTGRPQSQTDAILYLLDVYEASVGNGDGKEKK